MRSKIDNTAYAANDEVATINGTHSFINQIVVDFDDLKVLVNPRVNHAFVKKLVEHTKGYSDEIGPTSMYFYPDTATGDVSGSEVRNNGFGW